MEFNGTFIVALVSFGLFILIMNQIYYKPITKIITERKCFIDENYQAAENSKLKTTTILSNKEARVSKNDKKAKEVVFSHVEKAKENSKDITNEAKLSYVQEVSLAKKNLSDSERQMQSELQGNVTDIAEAITTKILGDV